MDKCEILRGLFLGFYDEGNMEAADGILQAMKANGCSVEGLPINPPPPPPPPSPPAA